MPASKSKFGKSLTEMLQEMEGEGQRGEKREKTRGGPTNRLHRSGRKFLIGIWWDRTLLRTSEGRKDSSWVPDPGTCHFLGGRSIAVWTGVGNQTKIKARPRPVPHQVPGNLAEIHSPSPFSYESGSADTVNTVKIAVEVRSLCLSWLNPFCLSIAKLPLLPVALSPKTSDSSMLDSLDHLLKSSTQSYQHCPLQA